MNAIPQYLIVGVAILWQRFPPQHRPKAPPNRPSATASAPRTPENMALAASKSSRDIVAREATAPMKMNSGTTVNEYATPGLAPVSSYGTAARVRKATPHPCAPA